MDTWHPDNSRSPLLRPAALGFGDHLRHWRQRRRLSQLELSAEAEVSTRHLSFVETGRSQPSREMVLRLCERLQVPLRERNALLIAAGFAPMYHERPLDHPALTAARRAVDLVLKGHEPFPALALDRHWNMVASNRVVGQLLAGVDPSLMVPPVNVVRLSLHPLGLAPQIVNLAQWREHVFERLRRQIHETGDVGLASLLEEMQQVPAPGVNGEVQLEGEVPGLVVPLRLSTPAGALSFISTTTVFGSAVEVTLQELAVESLFPADEATADILRTLV